MNINKVLWSLSLLQANKMLEAPMLQNSFIYFGFFISLNLLQLCIQVISGLLSKSNTDSSLLAAALFSDYSLNSYDNDEKVP